MFSLTEVAVAATLTLVATNQPIPGFDVQRYCRRVAARSAPVGNVEPCLRTERESRERLVAEWDQFAPADREHCLRLAALGVEPTYTELLTCLDVARDARAARAKEGSETTGAGR